jgi:hypothetical protein
MNDNNDDLVQIPLDDISSDAINESIKKFTRLLVEGWEGYKVKYNKMPWQTCKICEEVDKINNRHFMYCKNCPLHPSKWCRGHGNDSRLHKIYHITKKRWEKDVNDYIWWLTIEVETRDNYDNNAELQSMGFME